MCHASSSLPANDHNQPPVGGANTAFSFQRLLTLHGVNVKYTCANDISGPAFADKCCDECVYVCIREKDVSDLCKHGGAARQYYSYALIRLCSPSVHSSLFSSAWSQATCLCNHCQHTACWGSTVYLNVFFPLVFKHINTPLPLLKVTVFR